ncbi:hypothetical protein FRB90_009290 [Tulasnella sp. 427]|nr:hypothetical protein FRB90_009290 [Tulasnella sp. 427]
MEPTTSSAENEYPIANDMIRLNFSKDSVFNTIISSADNEIIYEVSTPKEWTLNRVTSIWKMDKSLEEKVFVGEVAWKALKDRTKVRVGWQTCEWMEANDWFTDKKGISIARTFTAAQGVKYRWKNRKLRLHLTSAESPLERPSPSLAIFHTTFFNGAYLEISSSVLRDLDHILVALLIMEKFRRDDRGD